MSPLIGTGYPLMRIRRRVDAISMLTSVAEREDGLTPGLLACLRSRAAELVTDILRLTPVSADGGLKTPETKSTCAPCEGARLGLKSGAWLPHTCGRTNDAQAATPAPTSPSEKPAEEAKVEQPPPKRTSLKDTVRAAVDEQFAPEKAATKQRTRGKRYGGRSPVEFLEPATGRVLMAYPSMTAAARAHNLKAARISEACRGIGLPELDGRWRYVAGTKAEQAYGRKGRDE